MHIDHKRLRELRLERMLTQGELGELAGLTLDTVNTAEAGHSISPKTARKLVTALGVEPKDLLPPKADAPKKSGRSQAEFEAAVWEMRQVFKLMASPEGRAFAESSLVEAAEKELVSFADVAEWMLELEEKRRGKSA